ncbi:MAG: putative Ig domain-containing protein, partial [Candidatus Poribacteria bacterium]
TVLAAPNRSPGITAIGDVTVVEGEVASVTASVTDPDGDDTQLDVQTDFLPSNITVDGASGEITFVTEEGVAGVGEGYYSVTVLATDGNGGETAVTFLLIVEPAQASGVQELAIRAALVSPKVGTAEDTFSFGAVVTTAGADPDSVTLTVVSDAGAAQEVAMGAVGAAAASGARYGVDLQLAPGVYTFTVVATAAGQTVTRDEDGPVVEEALIDISNLLSTGATEDIFAQFDLTNPNPGQTVTLGVDYRSIDTEAWLPAAVSGSISALRNGSHAFTWHSAADIPDALGETYQLRLTAGTSGERISDGFRVVNASPPPPTLDELEPSAESSLVVTGTSEILGADIDIILNDQNVGTTTAEGDGTFRFVTADLQPGTYELRGTASILGVSSVRSAPVDVVVDSAPPTLEVVSPERGSEVPTVQPLITFRVDFGLSGGDTSEVAVALNGKPAAVTFDETSQLYSVRETLFDQRLYLASVRASKFNGLTLSDAWVFTINLAAGDTIPPTAVSFEPTGSIADRSPTVKIVVSDGETGIDTESVEILLNGVPIAAPYSPKDETGGSAAGVPTDPLADGAYTASATFADTSGNQGAAEWSFAVDTTPPVTPTFTVPAPGEPATTSVPTFTVQGVAELESTVVVVVGGVVVGTVTPGADGTWALSVDLAAGTTDVQAQARDALEN